MTSEPVSWTAWRRDVFGDPYLVWHEGPDFTRLLALVEDEPAAVADMLAAGVAAGDDLAAASFAVLADRGRAPAGAEALLRATEPSADGVFLVRVAQALHALTGDPSWAGRVADVLGSEAFWGVRVDAALALATFPPAPDLVAALGAAVRAEDYLVRFHAANTLLRYAGRPRGLDAYRALFAKVASPAAGEPTSADRARWAEAAAELVALAGATPPG